MWGNGQTWSKNDTYAIMTWHSLLDEIGLGIQSSVKTYQGVYHLSRMNRNLVIPENNILKKNDANIGQENVTFDYLWNIYQSV